MSVRISLFISALSLGIFVSFVFPALAQSTDTKTAEQGWVSKIISGRELIPKECAYGRQAAKEDCGIAEMIQTLVNITRLILGVMGSAALIMFVWGGILFIISGGDSGKVQDAKKIIMNAVIGIIVILTAWLLINFVVGAFTKGRESIGEPAEIFEGKPITAPPEK